MILADEPWRVRTWYGLPVEILIEGDYWRTVRVGALSLPHPPAINLLVRRGLPQKARVRLSYLPEGTAAAGAVTGTAGGTSTLAMVAYCAHHVTDVLPLVGLSTAAVFLAEYKIWFMGVGLATNILGIMVMLRLLRRERKRALAILRTQEVPSS